MGPELRRGALREEPLVHNVLLMLSSERQPSPLEEVRAHATVSAARGKTALLATSFDDWEEAALEPGESVVVVYGDSTGLDNRLLGWGRFVAAHPWTDELEGGTIYAGLQKQKVKKKSVEYRTFLEVRDFVVARSRDRLDDFHPSLPGVARSMTQSKARKFFERPTTVPDPWEVEDAWRKSPDARDACRILSLDPAKVTVRQAELAYNKAIAEARNKTLLNRARGMIRQALYAERYHRE